MKALLIMNGFTKLMEIEREVQTISIPLARTLTADYNGMLDEPDLVTNYLRIEFRYKERKRIGSTDILVYEYLGYEGS